VNEGLPEFDYHPDPIGTGAVQSQTRTCRCCGERRGWVYVLGAYGPTDLRDEVCPWCIADGSAAARFDVRFNDLTGCDLPPNLAEGVVDEVEQRTPGFAAWQQERWLFHCDDAAVFRGAAGWEELEDHPDALAMVVEQVAGWGLDPEDAMAVAGSLDVDDAATAYLFECRHCGAHLAYADMA